MGKYTIILFILTIRDLKRSVKEARTNSTKAKSDFFLKWKKYLGSFPQSSSTGKYIVSVVVKYIGKELLLCIFFGGGGGIKTFSTEKTNKHAT